MIVQRAQQHAVLTKEEETALAARLRSRIGDILDDWSTLWREVIGARNRLIHGYDFVDLDIVWEIERVPGLTA